MITDETKALLEKGCALIVGAVDRDGAPFAARGWGLDLLPGGEDVRVLLDAEDRARLGDDFVGTKVAVTGTDVPTLSSVQLKGIVTEVADGEQADAERVDRYCDQFFGDIAATDGTPRELTEQIRAESCFRCVIHVQELYNQTPGPSAGRSMLPES